ncbi:MAG: choice-of-anchor L domain-containing protein [Sphingobacteriales bacterium JAD_PAG50586_3]|nr:MAG: choice-of-anchor L domain-containing protein [Sphingobacteriales bacterium JAD_PAG50586_3]
MKKVYLFAVLFFAVATCHAQLVVMPGTPANALAKVLGGSCANITNITYTGAPIALGVYNANNANIGLTEGMILTTGNRILAMGPNNIASSGVDNGMPGDALLTSICGFETYDAAILEFDFTSEIDDSVFVKYVFGSEEYPEFVGQVYNDVFGFFISGPGISGEQNISMIPGTSTPIAINNVNQISNTNYYVDNTGGPYLQYDGHTTVLYAKFFAQTGVTYHMKIKIADAGDGIYDSGVLLEGYPAGSNNISGYVTYQGNPASSGTAYLYEYSTDSTQAQLLNSQAIGTNGFYSFSDLPIGQYIVKGELDPNVYPNSFPKYHTNAYSWDSATIINIPCINYQADVTMLVLDQGVGVISGEIGYGLNGMKTTEQGYGYIGASVLLIGQNDNLVYRYCKSGENGEYSFLNVPQGEYFIVVDIPGLRMGSVRKATISAGNTNVVEQDYMVEEKIIRSTDILIVDPVAEHTIELSPIPANEVLNIKIGIRHNHKMLIELFDISGRKVKSIYQGDIFEGVSVINTSIADLTDGIYILRTQIGNHNRVDKIIKSTY